MCGIVGILSQNPVATELYDSLVQLQHRGQASAGIITINEKINVKLGKGLVREVFQQNDIDSLMGNIGIAHVRYPTAGNSNALEETQPFWLGFPYGMAMAHNGNLINYPEIKKLLHLKFRRHLNTQSDSEALLHLISAFLEQSEHRDSDSEFFAQLCYAIDNIFHIAKGSYSVICCVADKGIIAFRDPHGVRPLIMGKRGNKEYIFASENTPFFSLKFDIVDDVKPGEVIFVSTNGTVHRKQMATEKFHPCVFEYVYFARPDAILDDISVYRARLALGTALAKQWLQKFPDLKPDVVIPIPFSSNTAANAFAHHIGVRYSEGLYKNPFIGRTFIMPNQKMRKRSVRHKLSPQYTEIAEKNILLLDDSIVRGTTSKEIIRMVKEIGAKQVYLVSTAPPIRHPCFYGIDIPTEAELIANRLTNDEIQRYLGVDALLYQTETDLVNVIANRGKHHISSPCMACMNNKYYCGKPTDDA